MLRAKLPGLWSAPGVGATATGTAAGIVAWMETQTDSSRDSGRHTVKGHGHGQSTGCGHGRHIDTPRKHAPLLTIISSNLTLGKFFATSRTALRNIPSPSFMMLALCTAVTWATGGNTEAVRTQERGSQGATRRRRAGGTEATRRQ
eukprot:359185-Chlamydomonas_euryale.AAC.2